MSVNVEEMKNQLLFAWKAVYHASVSGTQKEVEESDAYAKKLEQEFSEALKQNEARVRGEERERIIALQDKIQADAICPENEKCPLCSRGLKRKCSGAEYRGMSEALEAISTPKQPL